MQWGREEGRGCRGQLVGSDSEEKVMILLAYCRLRMGNSWTLCALLCEAETLGRLGVQRGLGASCLCEQWGWAYLCFSAWCSFPFMYLNAAMFLLLPAFPGSLQLLPLLWQTIEQNPNQNPCSARIYTQKEQPAKYRGLKLPAVCWSVYLAWLMLFYLLKCHYMHPGRGGRNVFCTYAEFFWNYDVKRRTFHVKKLLFHLAAGFFVFLRLHFTCLGCICVIYWNHSPSSIIYAALQS